MLILFILTIGFVSASDVIDSDLNENVLSDEGLDSVDPSDTVSTEQSVDLDSNSVDAGNLNAVQDPVLQSTDTEPLASSIKPSGTTFNDIQKAVNKANTKDVIELNGTYTSSGKAITVKKSLTFNGVNGATLDGKKLSGIFYIPANATVTFNNIKFINAKQGGIYGDSYDYTVYCKVNLIIKNCSFKSNYNDYYGGAVYASSVKASDSNFTSNYVKEPDGDGISLSDGGAIYAKNIELTNCSFNKNHAQSNGGAVYCENSANVTSCVFKENYAWNGGAIYGKIYWSDELDGLKNKPLIVLKNSTFISNYLKSQSSSSYNNLQGGAVLAHNLNVFGCIFKNNSATYTGGKGGAIYGINIDARNSVFEKNIANYGGAISASRVIEEDTYHNGVLKIKNCSFSSNKEGAIRASKAVITNGNSTKTFKNKVLNNNLNAITFFKVTAKKFTTVYLSGKTMQIKVLTSPSSKPAKGLLLLVIAKSSKKKYSLHIKTNSKGIATLKASKLNAGSYKISVYESFCVPGSDPGDERYIKVPGVLKTSTLKVKKAKTIVKAPKVKYRYKRTRYFKVTVKHKTTKKAMSGIKLKLKVYTRKKYKTYTIKTNKKGVAKFNTKKLRWGKHKVKISSANKNVVVSKKSSIRIR